MKKALLFTSIIASNSIITNNANAGDITHLFYKPKAKQIVSETSYNVYEQDYENSSSTDVTVEKAEIREIINYGISSKLSFNLDIAYQEKESTTLGSTAVESDGLTNPKIETKYRVANQKDDGEFFDFKLSYTPDLFDYDEASTSVKGSVAAGGDVYSIGIDYGRDVKKLTYKVNFDATYYDDAKSTATNGTTTTYDDRTDIGFGLKTQYRFSDMISANAGITKNLKGNSSTDGVSSSGGNSTTLSTKLNFIIDPEKSAISVSFSQIDTDDTLTNNSKYTSGDKTTKYGMSYKYKF